MSYSVFLRQVISAQTATINPIQKQSQFGNENEIGLALGLGRATIFMARVGFRAFGFGPGRARATGKLPRVGFGLKKLKKLKFGPTSG